MRHLNTTILIIIFTLSLLTGAFAVSPAVAYAQNLVVDFEEQPLFDEANFLPGNEVVRTVEVTNNLEEEQSVIVEAVNASDSDGLGDELDLVIKEGDTVLYEKTLGEFLRAKEVSLSVLPSLSSTIYSFGITFNSNAGDDSQSTTLGFDLCIGFEGGDTNCGDTVAGGEGDIVEEGGVGGGGASSPGTGGGGGGQNIILEVSGETVAETDTETGTALIEWGTNYLATSQVIYGLKDDGPYTIDLADSPNFGYPLGTAENLYKTTSHSVLLTGLTVGEDYVFRVVSRASPPTIGFEYTFTFEDDVSTVPQVSPSLALGGDGDDGSGSTNAGNIITGNAESGDAETPEDEDKNTPADGEEIEATTSPNVAVALFGLPSGLSGWLKYIIPFIFIIIILYIILSRRRKKDAE